jgi:hypothetical protein
VWGSAQRHAAICDLEGTHGAQLSLQLAGQPSTRTLGAYLGVLLCPSHSPSPPALFPLFVETRRLGLIAVFAAIRHRSAIKEPVRVQGTPTPALHTVLFTYYS